MGRLKQGVNDLKTWCIKNNKLDILSEWDNNKNQCDPSEISRGYDKKMSWICSNGHSYDAIVKDRVSGHQCPYCANKKTLAGYNDLETTFPEIAKEWDYEKNQLKPSQITHGSKIKVWWKCPVGHSYLMRPNNRTSEYQGCPECAKEISTSFPEQAIYYYIKQVYDDAISREKEAISPYELDIYIPSIKVAIEYDGERYHSNLEKDLSKNVLCENAGIRLYRVREEKCPFINDDYAEIWIYNRHSMTELSDVIRNLINKISNITCDIDTKRDASKIYSQYLCRLKDGSLASKFPALLSLWDKENNARLDPSFISYGSNKSVWWKCDKGHSYQQSIANKTRLNQGCPYCLNKAVLKGYNDLETWCVKNNKTYILDEWDDENLHYNEVTYCNRKKIQWKCCNCGSTWTTTPSHRTTRGQNCPKCSIKAVAVFHTIPKNGNSLAEKRPDMVKEWNFTKNKKTPEEIAYKSNLKAWWICPLGHSYETTIANRTQKNSGCPYCTNSKVLVGFNDLETCFPEIALEWHPILNKGLMPSQITKTNGKKVWWLCPKGHDYEQRVSCRTVQKQKCPICRRMQVGK